MPLTQVTIYTMYCPRCDRPYEGNSNDDVLEKVKLHVQGQHPDHDPEWFETYPTYYDN